MPEPPLTKNSESLPRTMPQGNERLGQQFWPYPDDVENCYSRVVTMAVDGALVCWISKKYQGYTARRVSVVRVRATGRIFAHYQQRTPGMTGLWWNEADEKHLIGRRL